LASLVLCAAKRQASRYSVMGEVSSSGPLRYRISEVAATKVVYEWGRELSTGVS
jgi:hypothetical protein